MTQLEQKLSDYAKSKGGCFYASVGYGSDELPIIQDDIDTIQKYYISSAPTSRDLCDDPLSRFDSCRCNERIKELEDSKESLDGYDGIPYFVTSKEILSGEKFTITPISVKEFHLYRALLEEDSKVKYIETKDTIVVAEFFENGHLTKIADKESVNGMKILLDLTHFRGEKFLYSNPDTDDKDSQWYLCRDCGAWFRVCDEEVEWYASMNFPIPKRCKSCRDYRKEGL